MIELMTTAKFSKVIEVASKTKRISYIDAIVDYCQRNNIEVEQAAKMCNSKIKKQLKVEAINLNLLAD